METFKFEGMEIDRIVAHTVFSRGTDKQLIPPRTTNALIELDVESNDLIQRRITEALASASHGLEVTIADSSETSFLQTGALMIHASDTDFIQKSKWLASKLAEAQTNPRWPGGILILISGKIGALSNHFLAAIKAETEKGFNVVESKDSISLELIKNMLLSPTQKLYKIGMLLEVKYQNPDKDNGYALDNYRAFLFDHLLTATETKPAAAYFYNAFLGMDILGSSKYKTRLFYEETKKYINKLPIGDDEKNHLREALRVELRSQKGTILLLDFAKNHIPKEYRSDYVKVISGKGFPDHAVSKDTEYIKAKLRRPRKVLFSTGVTIQVPSKQDLGEHVIIGDQENEYTSVKIKGVVADQE